MSYQNGAPCGKCGQWINWGQTHYCSVGVPAYPPVLWVPPRCEHCFCRPDSESFHGVGPHRQCCKCFTTMAEQFINLTAHTDSPPEAQSGAIGPQPHAERDAR